MDSREIDRDVAGAADAHQRLLGHLDALLEGGFDPTAPSRLPDWTVGHVLTHIARNADSFTRALDGAQRGEIAERYPPEAPRDEDIAAGAPRPAAEHVADVRSTIWRLEATWSRFGAWEGSMRDYDGAVAPVAVVPGRRRIEVEVHHVDLGLGYEPSDWPSEFVRLELRTLEMRWMARRPMGMTTLPDAALAVPPHERLAWLLGRHEIPGLEPADVM